MFPHCVGRRLQALLVFLVACHVQIRTSQTGIDEDPRQFPVGNVEESIDSLELRVNEDAEVSEQAVIVLQLKMSLHKEHAEPSLFQQQRSRARGLQRGFEAFWCEDRLFLFSRFATGLRMSACMIIMLLTCCVVAGFVQQSQDEANVDNSQSQMSPSSTHVDEPVHVALPSLDGFKMLVATYAMLFYRRHEMPSWSQEIFAGAHFGVQVFYVATGFTTFFSCKMSHRVWSLQNSITFVLQKMTTFLPAYYLGLLISVVKSGSMFELKTAIAVTMFIQDFVPLWCQWDYDIFPFMINAPCWISAAVMIFWLFYPIVNNLLPRSGFKHAICVLFTVTVLRSLPTVLACAGVRWLADWVWYVFAPVRLLDFAIGAICASLCIQMPEHVVKWQGWGYSFDIALLVTIGIGGYVECFRQRTMGVACGDFLVAGPMVVLCAGAFGATRATSTSLFCRLLSCWPLPQLGAYSVSVYSLTAPVDRVLNSYVLPSNLSWVWLRLVIVWAVCLAIGYAVEKPFLCVLEGRMRHSNAGACRAQPPPESLVKDSS